MLFTRNSTLTLCKEVLFRCCLQGIVHLLFVKKFCLDVVYKE